MLQERSELSVDSRTKFVDLITSTPVHFSAFLELECMERAHENALKYGDYGSYRAFSDLTTLRRTIDKPFNLAWTDVRRAFFNNSGSPEENVRLLDFIRRDYRVDLMEIATEVANDDKAREAFGYIRKIRLIDQEHKYYEPEEHTESGFCLQIHLLCREVSRKGLSKVANRLDSKLTDAVKKSGVTGPFGEQFLIESVDKLVIKAGALKDRGSASFETNVA